MERLTETFKTQNSQLEENILRLKQKLHGFSNNNPTEVNGSKQESSTVPFNDGLLMDYYYAINRNSSLISQLNDEVVKIEGLI